MELANIEFLLERYFEGNTTLAEEATLRSYFAGSEVVPQLAKYQALFASFETAHNEVSQREIVLPQVRTSKKIWQYGVAAMLVVAVGIGSFMISQPRLSQEEEAALMAFNKSKEALLLLSESFNKGTNELAVLTQFVETKDRILK